MPPGYDCSGSVSFALHGGKFLESPLPSGPMVKWGEEGEGRWITVYANGGHAYAVSPATASTPPVTKAKKPARAGTKNCATTSASSPATRSASRSLALAVDRPPRPVGRAGPARSALPYSEPAKAPWPN